MLASALILGTSGQTAAWSPAARRKALCRGTSLGQGSWRSGDDEAAPLVPDLSLSRSYLPIQLELCLIFLLVLERQMA